MLSDQLSYALPKDTAEKGQYNNGFDNAIKKRNKTKSDQNSLHEGITGVFGFKESHTAGGKHFLGSEPSISVQEIPLNESARESNVVTVCQIYDKKHLVSGMIKEKKDRKYFTEEAPAVTLSENPIYESLSADTVLTDNPLYECGTTIANDEHEDQMYTEPCIQQLNFSLTS